MTIYEGNWTKLDDLTEWSGALDVLREPGVEVLYACYEAPSYEGYASVVWTRDAQLYEASCSHCSCDGLDAFVPELTHATAILMRPSVTRSLRAALEAWLATLEARAAMPASSDSAVPR